MSLLSHYQAQIAAHKISSDAKQIEIITALECLKLRIEREQSFIRKLTNLVYNSDNKLVHGIYLYSGVGRGKTMLMDLFYNNLCLPKEQKYRVHFHLFMRSIHQQMQQMVRVKDPIGQIIKSYKRYQIICLDEFLVHDIADAMILSRVIAALFKYKIKLVTTSNLAPDDLYKNGLQRELFLPAITAIRKNLLVLNLAGNVDYRAKMLLKTSCFFGPSDSKISLEDIFNKLSNSEINPDSNQQESIEIANRKIKVVKVSGNVVWFDFNVICTSPRSQNDYLEIAEVYKIVLLQNLPPLDDTKNDLTRRFINLIDILYDYNVKLIISSQVELEMIYRGAGLSFEFARTLSRLKEMQTEEYLSKIHL